MGDHFKQAASRRMILSVGLKVLSQMLDPASEKCDLHIRAAGIFVMQLKLLETRRLAALCHNEAPTLDEEPILATAHNIEPFERLAAAGSFSQLLIVTALAAAAEWDGVLVPG